MVLNVKNPVSKRIPHTAWIRAVSTFDYFVRVISPKGLSMLHRNQFVTLIKQKNPKSTSNPDAGCDLDPDYNSNLAQGSNRLRLAPCREARNSHKSSMPCDTLSESLSFFTAHPSQGLSILMPTVTVPEYRPQRRQIEVFTTECTTFC